MKDIGVGPIVVIPPYSSYSSRFYSDADTAEDPLRQYLLGRRGGEMLRPRTHVRGRIGRSNGGCERQEAASGNGSGGSLSCSGGFICSLLQHYLQQIPHESMKTEGVAIRAWPRHCYPPCHGEADNRINNKCSKTILLYFTLYIMYSRGGGEWMMNGEDNWHQLVLMQQSS